MKCLEIKWSGMSEHEGTQETSTDGSVDSEDAQDTLLMFEVMDCALANVPQVGKFAAATKPATTSMMKILYIQVKDIKNDIK